MASPEGFDADWFGERERRALDEHAARMASLWSEADLASRPGAYIADGGYLVIPGPSATRPVPNRSVSSAPASRPNAARPAAPAVRPTHRHLDAGAVNLLLAVIAGPVAGMRSTNVHPASDEWRLVLTAVHEASHAITAAHFGVASTISLDIDRIGSGLCTPAAAMPTADQERLFRLAGFVGAAIAEFGAMRATVPVLEAQAHATKAGSPDSDWPALGGFIRAGEIQQCTQIVWSRWSGVVDLAASHSRKVLEVLS